MGIMIIGFVAALFPNISYMYIYIYIMAASAEAVRGLLLLLIAITSWGAWIKMFWGAWTIYMFANLLHYARAYFVRYVQGFKAIQLFRHYLWNESSGGMDGVRTTIISKDMILFM